MLYSNIQYFCPMRFRIKADLFYDVYTSSTCIFNIQALGNSYNQKIISESLEIAPNLPFKEFSLPDSKIRFITVQANEFVPFQVCYQGEIDVKYKTVSKKTLFKNTSIFDLDNKIVPYLSPSRLCPSDKLMNLAFKLFGYLQSDIEKAVAVNDWIFNNVDYVPGTTDASTSAYDTLNQREGVCKDFAHLGIALCRALNIPARYFTCYATNINPPDIHACFEVYIGGQWIIFDPTRLSNLSSLVKIAHGKDGSEVAVASLFGNASCTYMNIECENLNGDLIPMYASDDFFISY
jgi:transglutaminase-like putative cysteine protease